MEERLERLTRSTAEAYECGCEIEIERVVPAVDNSSEMYAPALKAAEKALEMSECAFGNKGSIVDSDPCLASEDFAVYGTELPSFLYWVGSGTPGKENAMWHDPAFRVDPHYTETAVPLLAACALI
jgi:metal-dependent amidase/aminoacylase/carboxypeptidase family protein